VAKKSKEKIQHKPKEKEVKKVETPVFKGEFEAMQIRLASPEIIRRWSKGEVKKSETINYRTFKPEKDGLFCEVIFGPAKDWECACGKYRRIKHREIVCDRCGVLVTLSKVRRERMGHIELAVPVTHIWFLKGVPSRIGYLLDMSGRDLERVVYYESYIVTEPEKGSPFSFGQLINEKELNQDISELENLGLLKKHNYDDISYEEKEEREKVRDPIRAVSQRMFGTEFIFGLRSFRGLLKLIVKKKSLTDLSEQAGKQLEKMPADQREFIGTEKRFIVNDPAESSLKKGSMISEREYRKLSKKTGLKAVFAFEAVKGLAKLIDMEELSRECISHFEEVISDQKQETFELVINPGQLKKMQILSDFDYDFCERIGQRCGKGKQFFIAKKGAEAIRDLLRAKNLNEESKELRSKLNREVLSSQQRKEFLKKLRIIEAFRRSGNKPEWMCLEVIPVLPPDLRPLVPLDGGRFATSDLNDLYRRVISRNNRLKKLIESKAPNIIIHNEKRMLQEAVDVLFDNGRRGRPVTGQGNRPLKSLSEMLKGKQGRFRQNLLGKRVDYSGRSVIVVGPELKLYQCGLPKKMALELFKPFIIKKLEERGFVHTVKSAKRMVEKVRPEVWDILEEVIKEHPVLLNRAPTLHRQSIQAFEPVLVEGKAIKIHPMVCTAFNADFDGDQMAVHIPLSAESQVESRLLMLSTRNIFSTANGRPLASPSQDIVMGCYYLTKSKTGAVGEGKCFSNEDEVLLALDEKEAELHAQIKVKIRNKLVETTAGRIIFNACVPEELKVYDKEMGRAELSNLVTLCNKKFGDYRTVVMLDALKEIGFKYATLSGVTVSIDDFIIPGNDPKKEYDKSHTKKGLVEDAQKEIEKIESQYQKGIITVGEKYNKAVDLWTHVTDRVTEVMMDELKGDRQGFNPVYMMAISGARGGKAQIRQLAGMRGLMAKPGAGEIIETPIIANFREGLTVLEYFISTHGARKGLADTALKTADAGYLTRRLLDVAQDVVVTMDDCGTINGISIGAIKDGADVIEPLRDRIVGRVALDNVVDILSDEVLVKAGEEITEEIAERIEKATSVGGVGEKIRIRSVLTCEAEWGVCARCYGWNLSSKQMVEVGEAVGAIAAQSIGEPGTQLTLRTFHIGGTAARIVEQSAVHPRSNGKVNYRDLKIKDLGGSSGEKQFTAIVLSRDGEIEIYDEKTHAKESYKVPYGARLFVRDGEEVKKKQKLAEWEPYHVPIITEFEGSARFHGIDETTMKEEIDTTVNRKVRTIIKHQEEKHPRIIILDAHKKAIKEYTLPTNARLEVNDGDSVQVGDILAKITREISKTRDITGGLPRVAELFEARKPKENAVITEIEGTVDLGVPHHNQDDVTGTIGIVQSDIVQINKNPNGKVEVAGKTYVAVSDETRILKGTKVKVTEKLAGSILKVKSIPRGIVLVTIRHESGVEKEYNIPLSRHIIVTHHDKVEAGDPLTDGPVNPHNILEVKGESSTEEYLVDKVQEVYRLGGVAVNDKHIEVIVRQMLRRIRIVDPGDTNFLAGQQIDRFVFQKENNKIKKEKGKPAVAEPILLGITKASLSTDSFISAASFQETTRVLTEAAISGRVDGLRGLKENVIVGRMIPAGTGFPKYRGIKVADEEIMVADTLEAAVPAKPGPAAAHPPAK